VGGIFGLVLDTPTRSLWANWGIQLRQHCLYGDTVASPGIIDFGGQFVSLVSGLVNAGPRVGEDLDGPRISVGRAPLGYAITGSGRARRRR
jgi:hypothetical protein